MKVADAIGSQLDWVVAVASKKEAQILPYTQWPGTPQEKIVGYGVYLNPPERDEFGMVEFAPSTEWDQGGPILERECIGLREPGTGDGDKTWDWCGRCGGYLAYGPTPLVAGMRAFVASKLGEEVEIPKELT